MYGWGVGGNDTIKTINNLLLFVWDVTDQENNR